MQTLNAEEGRAVVIKRTAIGTDFGNAEPLVADRAWTVFVALALLTMAVHATATGCAIVELLVAVSIEPETDDSTLNTRLGALYRFVVAPVPIDERIA